MNNEQFRRLLASNSASSKSGDKSSASGRNASAGGATPGGLLGSRMRSSIPMTPCVFLLSNAPSCAITNRYVFLVDRRSVTGVDFARQLAEQRREGDQRPSKRFKSSAAPKGTKLPAGYQDRASLRNAQDEDETGDSIEKRIKALEEMVKLGQVDQATFEKLRSELGVGGDTGSTHMVKGLDWDLLKRVKAGEDISKAAEKPAPEPTEERPVGEDAEEEFERLMEAKGLEELQAAPKEQKEKKKGTMAPPPPRKKTRDEILQELRASRAAAAAASAPPPESILGSKFKKLGDGKPEKRRFIETADNGRRREVLLITDAEGNTKRKTRWLDKPGESTGAVTDLPMPDKDAKPLGMEVPAEIAARAAANATPEDDDDDIFAGVGADYDPLAGMEEEDSSSDEEHEHLDPAMHKREKSPIKDDDKQHMAAEPLPAKPRNYFGTSSSQHPEEPEDRSNPLTKDPTILAALKRAAALRQTSPSADDDGESAETSLRHKRFLEEARRRDAMDAADMDLGFGGSRVDDDEDEEAVLHDFEDERGGKKRKRGPKKKKGNKDSVSDVMRVLEGRKKEGE
ncbi:uncharacterized protein N7459_004114 [Penicillium hispanicum]|uniref:uncharacterized protein n=1 Tax=Penicillium hispanicum TaxID=1080232 RepID=UPI002540CED3|nr:uncharacterized protein N7459_004114 [Penicillium hispanicum]KAJ5584314.1 hypothetical protein N7459_004114 [Penicillium hispanicum]